MRLKKRHSALLVPTALVALAGQAIEYRLLGAGDGAQRSTVRASIASVAGTPLAVDYRLHCLGDDWKIYDVSIEGVSLAVNYRSRFSQVIDAHGIDGLIRQLGEKQVRGETTGHPCDLAWP